MSKLYEMRHIDLTVPETLNNGHPSHYVYAIRYGLQDLGYSGWTETRGEGAWRNEMERVTVFTIYLPHGTRERTWRQSIVKIGEMARSIMTDQEAIQLVDHGEVTIAEF